MLLIFFAPGSAPPVTTSCWINDGGIWKQATVWINDSGTWKAGKFFVNDGGTWRTL